jgi:hypothetical protein
LRGRGRVDVAEDLDEIAFGSIRTIREGKDPDDQREKRNQREEDLIRDRASEEGAIVGGEAHDRRPRTRKNPG